jgi:serine/threonine protein kinase
MYLETQEKLHRDISYTNILLREPGVESATKATVREEFMESLGLSGIEKLRKELNCREGLLIDFDYGALISGKMTQVEQESSDCERGEADEGVDDYDDEHQVVLEDMDPASQSAEEESQDLYVAPAPMPKPADPSGARTVSFSHL